MIVSLKGSVVTLWSGVSSLGFYPLRFFGSQNKRSFWLIFLGCLMLLNVPGHLQQAQPKAKSLSYVYTIADHVHRCVTVSVCPCRRCGGTGPVCGRWSWWVQASCALAACCCCCCTGCLSGAWRAPARRRRSGTLTPCCSGPRWENASESFLHWHNNIYII